MILLNSPAVSQQQAGGINVRFGTGKDIAGVVLFCLGLIIEALADIQKYRFKSVVKPPKGAITDIGVWKYSRRPNYFGEILLWWGMYILVLSPALERSSETGGFLQQGPRRALIASVFSPLLTMALLLFLSGIPLAEKPSQQKYFLMSHGPDGGKELEPFGNQHERDPWTRMKNFRERTSLLLPLPPSLYRPLPRFIKTYLLLDVSVAESVRKVPCMLTFGASTASHVPLRRSQRRHQGNPRRGAKDAKGQRLSNAHSALRYHFYLLYTYCSIISPISTSTRLQTLPDAQSTTSDPPLSYSHRATQAHQTCIHREPFS